MKHALTHPDRLVQPLRLMLLAACFFVVTGFDACSDDPILDPSGGTQTCHPSYGCSGSLAPSDTQNPARF